MAYADTKSINSSDAKKNAASIQLTDKPIDKTLHDRVVEKIMRARIKLLFEQPFFGNLATRMVLMPADDWLPTAAVDGKYFYFNHQFIDMLQPKEVQFLFGHEVLHLVYDHLGRREGREATVVDENGGLHSLHNIAADYVVNQELVDNNIGQIITTVPALYDTKYKDWSSEAIYDYLLDEIKKNPKNKNCSGLASTGGFGGMESEASKQFDEHLDENNQDGQKNGNKGGGKAGSGPVKMTDAQRREMKDQMREAMLSAIQTSNGAGNLPAGVQRLVDQLSAPKMDWRTLLRMQLESTVLSDFSYTRPSRTAWHLDAILPGMVRDQLLKIVVAVDQSGSISTDMAREFLSEVVGIMEQFPNYEILVMTYDTEIYNPVLFTSENQKDIRDYDIQGGGGTDFNCIYDWLKENTDEPPMRLINMTDGYPNSSWGDENYCQTLFVLCGTTSIVPPWGVHAYFDE